MPNEKRMERINEAVARTMAELLPEVKDPRLSSHMISVLRAEVTRDLSYAKIYLSVFGEYNKKELMAGLKSASGFLRRELGRRQGLRITPEPVFVLDDSIAYGAHIIEVINSFGETKDE